MYSFLGWFNVVALLVLTGAYWFPRFNRSILRLKATSAVDIIKGLRRIHKPLGLALLITAPLHGYLALGAFRLHTGTLVYLSLFLTALAGGSFYRTKKKFLFKLHKTMALITVLLLILHLVNPGALYGLF